MIQILECDFGNAMHRQAVIDLMNNYMADHMGGELPPHETNKAERMVEGLADHPSKLVLLAKNDDKFVGLTNCFVNFGTFAAKPFINIHDLVVLDTCRGKGIGRMIMNTIVEKAKELDCAKITLEVRDDNTRAQALYKSIGFDEDIPIMHFWSKYLD